MDKPGKNQTEKAEEPKSSGGSSSVLSILKRFRTRREAAGTEQPFDERLSAPSGPLSEKISEISSRIEASRAQGEAAAKPAGSTVRKRVRDGLMQPDAAPGDAAKGSGSGAEPGGSAEPEAPRLRDFGFHKPVYQPTDPEAATHPDFKASTEPPAFKVFDAPDGVMENYGAPEKRVTQPQQKVAEPFDLDVFAKHLRATLPKKPTEDGAADADTPAAGAPAEPATGEASPEEQAAQFKRHFQARLQKASSASAFVPYPVMTPPRADPQPTSAPTLRLREATAHSALQRWRELQSSTKPDPEDPVPHPTEEDIDPITVAEPPAVDATAEPLQPDPADHLPGAADHLPGPVMPAAGFEAPLEPLDTAPQRPAAWPKIPQDSFARSVIPSPDAHSAPDTADPDQTNEQDMRLQPEPDLPQMVAPEPVEVPEYQPETLEEFEPPADASPAEPPPFETAPEPADLPADPPVDTEEPQAELDNIFAALDLDEDEILMKVYDLIQAELQAAWGENITLNIRKMVRAEVHAAVMRARSGL